MVSSHLCQVSNSLSCWACNSGDAIYVPVSNVLILLQITKNKLKTPDFIKLNLERIPTCVYVLITLINNSDCFPADRTQMTHSHSTFLNLSPQDAHGTRNCNNCASTQTLNRIIWTSSHLLLKISPNCTRWFVGFAAHFFSCLGSSISFKNQ